VRGPSSRGVISSAVTQVDDMRIPDRTFAPLAGLALTLTSLPTGPSLAAATFAAPARAGQRAERIPTLILTGENTDRDWRYTSTHLRQILEDCGKFDVEITLYPHGALVDPGYLERFELVVVDYHGARWGDEPEARLASAVEGGAGLLVLGHAGSAFPEWNAYGEMLGRPGRPAGQAGARESDPRTFDVEIVDAEHPITRGLEPLRGLTDRVQAGLRPAPDASARFHGNEPPAGRCRSTGRWRDPPVRVRRRIHHAGSRCGGIQRGRPRIVRRTLNESGMPPLSEPSPLDSPRGRT